MTAFWVAGATFVLTLGGGLIVLRLQVYQGIVFAFCAGALIAGALMEVIPESLELLSTTGSTFHHHHILLSCALGFLCFYLVEHLTHQREAPAEQAAHHAHAPHAGIWGATGILVHSLFDGFAIGQGFHAGEHVGWAIALGITLHKIADGASIAGVMLGTRQTVRATRIMLVLTALAPLAGVYAQSFVTFQTALLALLLAWFGGVFLYLGAGSLLPAAHDASHSRQLPVATLAGVLFVYGAQLLTHH